ncbi:MAG TPA: tetratricopeptide repeat protein [Anaerolineaceae bacterium]|nr:tetratricopeptide repeat protein [Anaerolineaceae bacterium]
MRPPPKNPSSGYRFYAFLVKLYPPQYQQAFGAQMLRTFQDYYTSVRQEQGRVPLAFWINVISDEMAWIAHEQLSAFAVRREVMIRPGSNGKQWLVGVIAGLALVAAAMLLNSVILSRFAVLIPLILLLVAMLGMLAVVIAVLGKVLATVLKSNHFARPLDALVSHWRIEVGLFGAIILPVGGYFGALAFSPPTDACMGKVIAPSAPAAQLVTAQDYFKQGDYEYDQGNCSQAIADYTQAIALNSQDAQVYNNRAYTYMLLHQYDMALADLNKAIAIRPDYIIALMNRGDIYNYYYAIDHGLAIADYDRVMAIDPLNQQHTQVHGHMAFACFFRGDIRPLVTNPDKTGPDCQFPTQP